MADATSTAAAISKKVISSDGTEIYAEARGDPSKPVIIFLHGFSMSSLVFDDIFGDPRWTEQAYLVRYDMRGHGRSGKPIDESAWESKRLSEDFDAVVDAFKLRKPFVVGWSLGATNITDVLSFHPPSYLAGIIYVSALPYMGPVMAKVGTPLVLGCLPSLMQTTDVVAYQTAAQTFVGTLSSCMSHTFHQACLGNFIVQPRAVTTCLLTRTQSEVGLLEAGRSGLLPMLVVKCKRDRVVIGEESLKAVEGWKDLQVVELDNADHMPWLSEKVAFNEAVLDWIQKTK